MITVPFSPAGARAFPVPEPAMAQSAGTGHERYGEPAAEALWPGRARTGLLPDDQDRSRWNDELIAALYDRLGALTGSPVVERRPGRGDEAYRRARDLTGDGAERRFLERRPTGRARAGHGVSEVPVADPGTPLMSPGRRRIGPPNTSSGVPGGRPGSGCASRAG
ncbi:hypothetical protein [Nonomuraea antri]|uniref:hypothetical protein n=1 Tax=Nonomuraea antri TaxID=2730852 RepID=UPI00156A1DBC|nr:hypothetical protein [Nonomuraea antri]